MIMRNKVFQRKESLDIMSRKKLLCCITAGVIGFLIAALLCVVLYRNHHYKACWFEGTVINGLDVSGQTMQESQETVVKNFRDFSITIKGRKNGCLVIQGKDIDYSLRAGSGWEKLFDKQHKSFSLLNIGGECSVNFDVSYDTEKLKTLLLESELVAGSGKYKIQNPISAHAGYDKEKAQCVCIKEVKGNKILPKKLLAATEQALRQAKTELDIEDEKAYPGVYEEPPVTSEDKELVEEIALCNNAIIRFINFRVGEGIEETITPKQIAKWVTYKNGKIKYKNKAIKAWADKFSARYSTVGNTRTILSHTGKKVKIYGGDYGWLVDSAKTLKQIKKALMSKVSRSLTEAYISNPKASNKKALTFKKKVSYLNTAHKRSFGKSARDWDKKNYTEISLSEQMVYVFRKGKVAFSCRCISGLPVEKRITRTGAYYIKEHRPEYTMTGDDYSTHVRFWVRITWTGTGFHPATWQPWSRWSKTLYMKKGSHGCITLSPPDAEKIYHMVAYREAVFIHR